MGRGDKKSKKGKLRLGSYGNSRKKHTIKLRIRRRLSVKPLVPAVVEAVEVVEAKPKVKRTTKKKTEATE